MSSRKVAYLQRRIPHYRLPFFKELNKQLHNDLDLLTCPFREKGGSGIEPDYSYEANFYFFEKQELPFYKALFFQKGLLSQLRKQEYSVVVVEGTLNNLTVWATLLARRMRSKKSIIWLKGWPNARNGFDFYIRKLFLGLSDRYIVYGERSIPLLERYGIPDNKIFVAQNTVELSDLYTSNLDEYTLDFNDFEINSKYILYFGRIVSKKRVIDLIKAFSSLQKDGDLTLVIVGDGPERPVLEKWVDRNDIKNVHFTGKVSDRDLNLIIKNALFCVFPGAVGLSLNQSMAAGKLTICADEPGPDSELIIHQETGIRFKKGSVEELSNFIEKFITDDKMRDRIGKEAQKYIGTSASIKKMAQQHAFAVKEVLE